MESRIRKFFDRYAGFFEQSLAGDVNPDELASLYASEFIGASPAGVRAGVNDEEFRQATVQGYANYRAIGTKEMRVRDVRVHGIDDHHCLANVAWTAVYARPGQDDAVIDFEVHYMMQVLDGEPKVFGWISGDEQALLREHGVG